MTRRSSISLGALLVVLTPYRRVIAAQDWATRFPPHADCRVTIRRGSIEQAPGAADGGTILVVRPVRFGTQEAVRTAFVELARLGAASVAVAGLTGPHDPAIVCSFSGLAPGQYSLRVRATGYHGRTDTIPVEAGAAETVRVALELDLEGDRNVHNCRPRGFRRPGESACVTEGHAAESERDYARSFAEPERRRAFNLPAIDTSRITLVRDERVCDRAARAYGHPDDPPRRMIVVRLDRLYLAYDPFEPVAAGEWDVHCIYDRSWRPLVCLAD